MGTEKRERNPSKSLWTKEEDEVLRKWVESTSSRSWTFLAKHLTGRTGKQCRERWVNHLDSSINKHPWTPAEDRKLLQLHSQLGNRWVEFTKELKGRSENSIKNRWNSILKKRIAKEGDEPQPPSSKKSPARTTATSRSPPTRTIQKKRRPSTSSAASSFALEQSADHSPTKLSEISAENSSLSIELAEVDLSCVAMSASVDVSSTMTKLVLDKPIAHKSVWDSDPFSPIIDESPMLCLSTAYEALLDAENDVSMRGPGMSNEQRIGHTSPFAIPDIHEISRAMCL